MSEGQQDLLNTDDPEVWAAEFTRFFTGRMISAEEDGALDVATITNWFANYKAAVIEHE